MRPSRLPMLIASLLLSGSVDAGPTLPSTALTPLQARQDLELAVAALEAGLPDIHWHQSPHEWREAKTAARRATSTATDARRLRAILLTLIAHVGEGHVSLDRSEALVREERESGRFLPLDLHFSTEGVFVLRGYGDAADIAPGTRLLSINGEGPGVLVHEAMVARIVDGRIPTEAMRAAGGRGYALFRYRMRGAESAYRLRLSDKSGYVTERTVAAIPAAGRPLPLIAEPSPLPVLEWLGNRTAYLVVPTFSNRRYRAAGASYPDTIRTIFERLDAAGTRDLILDLRENGGGSEPNESILFSYLVASPIRRYASVEARGRTVMATAPDGRTLSMEVYDAQEMRGQRVGAGGRLFRRNLPPEGLMSHWKPSRPVFHGRLVVLAGGTTFSGAAELSSMLFHAHRAVFVGEEVGGADAGNSSGYSWRVTLPHSGLVLGVPLLRFRFAWNGWRAGRGVMPQCDVPPRAAEVGQRRDTAWRTAVALLGERWSRPLAARCPRV